MKTVLSKNQPLLIFMLAVALFAGLAQTAAARAASPDPAGHGAAGYGAAGYGAPLLQPTPASTTVPGAPPAEDAPPARSWILMLGLILGCMVFMLAAGVGISILMVRLRERISS